MWISHDNTQTPTKLESNAYHSQQQKRTHTFVVRCFFEATSLSTILQQQLSLLLIHSSLEETKQNKKLSGGVIPIRSSHDADRLSIAQYIDVFTGNMTSFVVILHSQSNILLLKIMYFCKKKAFLHENENHAIIKNTKSKTYMQILQCCFEI